MNPKLAAALATILWGFTYTITTSLLPPHPLFIAAVRALGAAVPLVLIAREVPPRDWWGRLIVLGTLNSGLLFAFLFVAALRLPGGVAATFQALTPLLVLLLAWPLLGRRPTVPLLGSVLLGVAGVALVVLKGGARVDPIGVGAALSAAMCVGLGSVLANRWGRPSSLVGFTAWQLLIAGVELTLVTVVVDDVPAAVSSTQVGALFVLALAITALPFTLWFRGIEGAGAGAIAPFILLTPLTAFLLDLFVYGLMPTPLQIVGAALVLTSLVASQRLAPPIATRGPIS